MIEFSDYGNERAVSDCQVLKKDSAPWDYLLTFEIRKSVI
jgi:hypothetical protein